MATSELSSYKSKLVKNYEDPTILEVIEETSIKNAGNTGGRNAFGGMSWIDYWRAVTGNYATTLRCSSCGKVIVVGEPTLTQRMDFVAKGETKDDHKAEGGHMWVTAPDGVKWRGGLYITPLCPACNAKLEQYIPIKIGSELCKEVGASNEKK